jgi:hypothetical protein
MQAGMQTSNSAPAGAGVATRQPFAARATALVEWQVRAGSLGASLRERLFGTAVLGDRTAESDVTLAWELRWNARGASARCELRSASGKVASLLDEAQGTMVLCEQTGLVHLHIEGDAAEDGQHAGLWLVATLRERSGVWHAMYARSNAAQHCGLAGGRYEVARLDERGG